MHPSLSGRYSTRSFCLGIQSIRPSIFGVWRSNRTLQKMDRAWNSQTQRAYWLLARWLSNYHHHEQELPITTRLSLSKLVKALVDVGIITGHLSSLASHLESIFAILKSGFFSLHQVRHSSSKFLITVNSLNIRQSSPFIVSLGPTFFCTIFETKIQVWKLSFYKTRLSGTMHW